MPSLELMDDLALRLGLTPAPWPSPSHKRFAATGTSFDAANLSLGLTSRYCPGKSAMKKALETVGGESHRPASSHSGVSSLSNGKVKRERDLRSEEPEVERVSTRNCEEDEVGHHGRKKLRLSKHQSALLEESFNQHTTLNHKQKLTLAQQLNLRPRQVEVWFQNRRARTKLKQTEVDCEFLKKCCEALSEENRRLQKELQELKAIKLRQQYFLHTPATLCPSCDAMAGSGVRETAAPKPQFYSSFTSPSAAC